MLNCLVLNEDNFISIELFLINLLSESGLTEFQDSQDLSCNLENPDSDNKQRSANLGLHSNYLIIANLK